MPRISAATALPGVGGPELPLRVRCVLPLRRRRARCLARRAAMPCCHCGCARCSDGGRCHCGFGFSSSGQSELIAAQRVPDASSVPGRWPGTSKGAWRSSPAARPASAPSSRASSRPGACASALIDVNAGAAGAVAAVCRGAETAVADVRDAAGADRGDRRPRGAPRRHRRRRRQRRHRDRRAAADGRAGDGRGDDRRQPARRLAHRPGGAPARARAARAPAADRLGGGGAARRRASAPTARPRRASRRSAARCGSSSAARRDRRRRLLPVPRHADGRRGRALADLRSRKSRLPSPIAKTWPLEPAIERTVDAIEKRSRAIAHPPFLRGLMAIRGVLDNPLTDRAMVGSASRRWRRRSRPRPSGSARRAAARAVGGRLIGSVVAGHRILRLVGRGGMGVVYEAVEEALGAHRGAEARRARAGGRAGVPRAFHRRVAAGGVDRSSERPAGVRGRRGGRAAVPGDAASSTAPTCARSRRLTRCARRAIVAQVGAALDAAHARRLVHRDVKPANVLIAPRRPRVPDRLRAGQGARRDAAGHTRTGDVVGTLDYVAPERIRGEGDGPAARPLLARLRALLRAHRRGPVPGSTAPSASSGRTCPSRRRRSPGCRFDAVIARALAKDPARAVRERRGARRGGAAIAARGRLARRSLDLALRRRAPQRARRIRAAAPELARTRAPSLLARASSTPPSARRAPARGARGHTAGADRAAAGRGPRRPGPRQGAARRRARPAPRGAAPDARGAGRLRRRDRADPARARDRPRARCSPTRAPPPANDSRRCRTSSRRSPSRWLAAGGESAT